MSFQTPNKFRRLGCLRYASGRKPPIFLQKRCAGPIRCQWTENQVRKIQAPATKENFSLEMKRMSERLQTRNPANTAKRLRKIAGPVTKFIMTKYLSRA